MLCANKKAFHCKSYLEGMILITKEIITEILNINQKDLLRPKKNGHIHHFRSDYDHFFIFSLILDFLFLVKPYDILETDFSHNHKLFQRPN